MRVLKLEYVNGFAVLVLLGAIMLLLQACDLVHFNPSPNPQSIPIYPSAQNVSQTTAENDAKIPVQVLRFETSDTWDKVSDFYKEHLVAQGWYLRDWQPYPDTVHFVYSEELPNKSWRTQTVDVIRKSLSNGLLTVEIQYPLSN